MAEIGKYRRQSEELKALRLQHAKKLEEMADIAGISKSYWSQIENGQRKIPEDALNKIQQKFANFHPNFPNFDDNADSMLYTKTVDTTSLIIAKERAEAKMEIYKSICDKLLDKAVVLIGADLKGVLTRLENDVSEVVTQTSAMSSSRPRQH